MNLEHIVFSAAIAIVTGLLFLRLTGRDTSWIIILTSLAPDIDMGADHILKSLGFTVYFEGGPIQHGTFHTIFFMVIFAVIIAFLLHPLGVRLFDSFVFSIIGFGAHLLEDALVYPPAYRLFWPISSRKIGLGWLPVGEVYSTNLFNIANTQVLLVGLALLIAAISIRTLVEGWGWVRWYIPEKVYTWFCSPLVKET